MPKGLFDNPFFDGFERGAKRNGDRFLVHQSGFTSCGHFHCLENLGRQVSGNDHFPFGQNNRSLDGILQLTYVPRPGILEHYFQGLLGKSFDILVILFLENFQEMVGQEGNIPLPFPERREREGDDVEAREEVFSKGFPFHCLQKVHVCGGD